MKIFLALIVLLATLCPNLHADTLRTFELSDDGNQYGILTGQLTIDTTTGQALFGYMNFHYYGTHTDADHRVDAPLDMSILGTFSQRICTTCTRHPDTQIIGMGSGTNVDGSSYLVTLSIPTTLVDYMGGQICYSSGCDGDAYTYFAYNNVPSPSGPFGSIEFFSGAQLNLVSTAETPEPSTWMLFATGAFGLVGMARKKLSSI